MVAKAPKYHIMVMTMYKTLYELWALVFRARTSLNISLVFG